MKDRHSDDARIYEAFSGEAEIPASFEDRLAESYEVIRRESRGKEPEMTIKPRKQIRTIAILAAAAAALSISALAIYQRTLGDAVLPDDTGTAVQVYTEEPSAPEENGGSSAAAAADIQKQWLHMSLNGFSDSPEYRAYQEWNEWNDAWKAENPDPWAELGEDDSYFETPENYAYFYDASFPAQGAKLEEILGKYDLSPHTARCGIESEKDLCAILGIEDLYSEEIPAVSGYIYDDGSFKTETLWFDEDTYRDMTVFFGVKGSFTMISGFMPADYEEWEYTTGDGTVVLLALGRADGTPGDPQEPQTRGAILAELEGGYVYAGFSGIEKREELEHWADCIGFAALNERFVPGSDRSGIAAAVEERFAEMLAANEEAAANWYAPFADKAERDAAVFAELGRYAIRDLPEGYEPMSDFAEWKPEGLLLAWDLDENTALSTIISGGVNWKGEDSDGIFRLLQLSWQRYYDRNDPEKVTNDVEFENAREFYKKTIPGKYTETTVNGYDALLVNDAGFYLVWFDTDRGLQFTLEGDGVDEYGSAESLFTDAELIAMAESVTED